MKIKVCGITDSHQAAILTDLCVDYLGFIFYNKSPRFALNFLTLGQISQIPNANKVGVFVNESLENITQIVEEAKLSMVQLHGNEDKKFITMLREYLGDEIEIIRVIRIGNSSIEKIQAILNLQPSAINYLLFDTDSRSFGGTGKSFDWQILSELNIQFPLILSGGISPEQHLKINNLNPEPFALDINSKFEISPGIKDLTKIEHFLKIINKQRKNEYL